MSVTATTPVGGGCISPAARLTLEDGSHIFLKWTTTADEGSVDFDAEVASLVALAGSHTLRVPIVLAHEARWLALEWLEPGSPRPGTWQALGDGLARMHRTRGESFGWPSANRIGSLPQSNTSHARWPAFWREERLLPQWHLASAAGHFDADDARAFERLCARLDDLLACGQREGPSLLHGDLWSGNVHILADGWPALIDPACCYGHREVDLAMADLFGGFDAVFFEAYDRAWPVTDGYAESRRPIYQLYYLLVHVNLFGAGYRSGVRRALRAIAC